MTSHVKCPTCNRAVRWSDNQPWRPFCSERCQIIDLGEWLAASRRIPETPAADATLPDRRQSIPVRLKEV